MIKNILVLTTGGTIDAKEVNGPPPEFITPEGSNRAYLALLKIRDRQTEIWKKEMDFQQIQIADKDSKNLTEANLQALQDHIRTAQVDRIIVTMGTDRLCEIAEEIKHSIPAPPCPVIFTGAMWPLANGPEKSDGFQNLEQAAFWYPDIPPDIYVTGGDIFMVAGFVEKDFEKRCFVLKPGAPDWSFAK